MNGNTQIGVVNGTAHTQKSLGVKIKHECFRTDTVSGQLFLFHIDADLFFLLAENPDISDCIYCSEFIAEIVHISFKLAVILVFRLHCDQQRRCVSEIVIDNNSQHIRRKHHFKIFQTMTDL
ncbi:hypothetical protein SDC9_66499 [bioreactor metagenome]|uniref:Uncharacterized protein n=1 Tax=bioreactor metagenome TaxID=1076179 RepID=A0A644XV23_9ZZZZ